MHRDRSVPPPPAARAVTLYDGGDGSSHFTVRAELLPDGDLRLLRINTGYFVARYAGEYLDRWLWWSLVDHAEVPALVEPGGDVLDAVRVVVSGPAPPTSAEEAEARFHAWLDSRQVPRSHHEYDEYPD